MKVLFVSGQDGDTRRYRCLHPKEQLALKGVGSEVRGISDFQLYRDSIEYDLFILHRVPHNEFIQDLIELAQLQGKAVIFETDDLVFDPDLFPHVGYLDTLSTQELHRFQQEMNLQAKTFHLCRAVLTTTESLASEARRRGKEAHVHRNAPSQEMIRISEQAYQQYKQDGISKKETTIGYFSGTGSHDRDFRVVTPALIAILENFPTVGLHISGHLNLDPVFEPWAHRIQRAPYISWRELPYLMARVDINLAPLEIENPFCQSKSEIKFIEAALVGTPTVATPTDAYRHAITDGVNGLWAVSREEWFEALSLLIKHPEKRRTLAEAARQTVYAQYTPERRGSELLSLLETIAESIPAPRPTPDCLALEIAERMKRHLDQLLAAIDHQERQLFDLRRALEQSESRGSHLERQYREKMEVCQDKLTQREKDIREVELQSQRSLKGVLERLKEIQKL
jgi:glycosyltransferase involved in cell wall biosynthesis